MKESNFDILSSDSFWFFNIVPSCRVANKDIFHTKCANNPDTATGDNKNVKGMSKSSVYRIYIFLV